MSKEHENSEAYKQAMLDAADIVRAKIREIQEPITIEAENAVPIEVMVGQYSVPSLIVIEKVFRNRAKGKVNGE